MRTEVRSQNHDHVLEIDHTTLTIGQTTIVKHLQQNIKNLRMRLLDFVKQDHRVWASTNGFGKLTALFIADVARRGADESRDRVLLAVLTHVDAHHRLLIVEQEFSQALGELGLTHTGRAQEQERAGWAVRVANASLGATNCV